MSRGAQRRLERLEERDAPDVACTVCSGGDPPVHIVLPENGRHAEGHGPQMPDDVEWCEVCGTAPPGVYVGFNPADVQAARQRVEGGQP